ncbi:CHRD domain-containing protein [Rhizobium sp. 2YAF20]|uniref:CHRD domain-containing protein n=1 Tax=Rhizobium sp. 2YAF20 TaxID=3233027 RepID=UPI003F99E931
MNRNIRFALPLTLAAVLGFSNLAHAEVKKFSGTLTAEGAAISKGKGKVWGSYDTAIRKLSYKITWSGLTGPVTAAHFHCPASVGENAGVLVPIKGAFKSGMTGSAKVDAKTGQAILAGKTYLNLHTAANPNGEIRAQVLFTQQQKAAVPQASSGSSSY